MFRFQVEKGLIWENSAIDEICKRADTGKIVVRVDLRYLRKTEFEQLYSGSTKASKKLKWSEQITLNQLVSEMIQEYPNEVKKESMLINKDFYVHTSKE